MKTPLDADRALTDESLDEFGFAEIAKRLAPAILDSARGEGMVIGIEGKWGSGKTTFLNYLSRELSAEKNDKISTISIAPWLEGETSLLIPTLMGVISSKLEKEIVTRSSSWRRRAAKNKAAEIGDLVRSYTGRTARGLAPIATLAGHFIPGAQAVGGALKASADVIEQLAPRLLTPSELKARISRSIQDSGMGFIVILDDLDRLEPAQVVEVVRLVRSVADFPKVTYILCYDRAVVANALSRGLSVENGDTFLQKVVQLTFTLPQPEPFDLRMQFLDGAKEIYRQATQSEIPEDILDDLKSAVDSEGTRLTTPREVKLTLNGVKFIFTTVVSEVYFPDLCRLHLIKVTHRRLYDWLERYLAARSVLVTENATIADETRREFGEQLIELLPASDMSSANSVSKLGNFVPGVNSDDEAAKRVFGQISHIKMREFIARKRLGSPLHYRFYFALTGPKNVLADEAFFEILFLAGKDLQALEKRLSGYAKAVRRSGTKWLAHVIDRLDKATIEGLTADQLTGLIVAFSNTMDDALIGKDRRRAKLFSIENSAVRLFKDLLSRLHAIQPAHHAKVALDIARNGTALTWLIGTLYRDEVWNHGRVGNRPSRDETVFDAALLDEILPILKARMSDAEVQSSIQNRPNVADYLFGWRDVVDADDPKKWVVKFVQSDENFLKLLDDLRTWAVSDRVYYPLQPSSISAFLDPEETRVRLQRLTEGRNADRARELIQAIAQGRD